MKLNAAGWTCALSAAGALGFALAAAPFVRGHFGNETLIFEALFVALLAWLAWGVGSSSGRTIQLPAAPLPVAVILFPGWLALSTMLSSAPSASAPTAWQIGSFGLAFAAMLCARDRESSWMGAIGASLIVSVAWAFVAAYQYFVLGKLPTAFFFQPNAWAGFLNIVLFGAVAVLLGIASESRLRRIGTWIVALWIAYSLGLSGSRGAFLAAVVGFVFLAVAGIRAGKTRQTLPAVAVILVAIIAGGQTAALHSPLPAAARQENVQLSPQGIDVPSVIPEKSAENVGRSAPLLTRLSQIFDREATLKHRLVIWRPTVGMFAQAPWHGIGPGVFWLLYPKYREPSDTSAGFHAHNDYLEAAVEIGLPGLILLLLLPAAALVAWHRSSGAGAEGRTLEAAALAAGVVATFAHSAVDFNLYVLPITLVLGIWLARLHDLADRARPYPRFALAAGHRVKAALRLGVFAILGAVAIDHARLALSAYYYEQARSAVASGKGLEATAALDRSLGVTEAREVVHIAYADLYLKALVIRHDLPPDARFVAATRGLDLLDRAQKMNPLRSDVALLSGSLNEQNAGNLGQSALLAATTQYEVALARDPRNLEARIALMKLLDSVGDVTGAHAISEAGLVQFYPRSKDHVLYLALAAGLRAKRGDLVGAEQLADAADRQLVAARQSAVVLEGLHEAHAALFAPRHKALTR